MDRKIISNILVMVLLLFLLTGCGNSSTPESVVTSYYENLKNGQYAQAAEKLANSVFLIQGLNKEQFSARLQTIYNQNSLIMKEFKIVETKVIDNTHTAVTIQWKGTANGKDVAIVDRVIAIKETEKWKLDINDVLVVTKAKKQMSWNIGDGKLTISDIMVGECIEGKLLRFKVDNQTNSAVQLGWAGDWSVKIITDKGSYIVPMKAPVKIAPGGNDIIFAIAKEASGVVQKASLQGLYLLNERGLPNGEAKTFNFDVVL
jgi:hypothetical protein